MKRNLLLVLCMVAFLGVVAGIDPFHVRPWIAEPARREEPPANQGQPEKEPSPGEARVPSPADIDDGEPASTEAEILAWRGRSRTDEGVAMEFFTGLIERLSQAGWNSADLERVLGPCWPEACKDGSGAAVLAELKRLAVERPAEFDDAAALLTISPPSSLQGFVESLKACGADVRKCDSLMRPLDALGLPCVRGRRREAVVRSDPCLPLSPWLRGKPFTAAWDAGGGERGDAMLFDDGVVRRTAAGAFRLEFPDEVRRFLRITAADAPTDHLLWLTALFARWSFETCRYEDGLACCARMRELGARAWPGETEGQLGDRAMRCGRFLQWFAMSRENAERGGVAFVTPPGASSSGKYVLLGSDLVGGLDYARREKRWGSLSEKNLLALPRAEQVEAALWYATRWRSPELYCDNVGAALAQISDAPPGPVNPAAWLRSLGWDAVPALVDHLADHTLTESNHCHHVLQVADVSWLALQDITGLPMPPGMSPEEPWITDSEERDDICASIRAWWDEVASLPEVDRWESLFRRGSFAAAKWLMANAPERCMSEAWRRFDSSTRRGMMQRIACERELKAAPREKLEALLAGVDGEALEAVQRALEAQDAK